MAKTDYTIEGARDIERVLEAIGPKLAGQVGGNAVRAGARVIVKEAKRLVPVRSGHLRDSIKIVTLKKNQKASDVVGVLIGFEKPSSRIAHLIEFGTSHSAAQPFMRPAMDSQHSEILDAIGKALASGVIKKATKIGGEG
jgi:HK97 gp10 family phage protein